MSALIRAGTNDIIPFQEVAYPVERSRRCPVRSNWRMASSQELEAQPWRHSCGLSAASSAQEEAAGDPHAPVWYHIHISVHRYISKSDKT